MKNLKDDTFLFAFNRWVLYMWTTAQMLRAMDFVFHRVIAVAQTGTREIKITIILLFKMSYLVSTSFSVFISNQDARCWQ